MLYNLLEGIRYIAVLLQPFMPDTNKAILEQINCDIANYDSLSSFGGYKAGTQLGQATPLFVRIDPKQFEADLEAMQKANAESEKAIEEIADETAFVLPEHKPEIAFDDFEKVELRVAKVLACEKVKKSKKLLKFTLDDGEGERTILSGIAEYYDPEELVGKNIAYVANLAPRKMMGIESCGMILSAESGDGLKVVTIDDSILPGGSLV